MLTMKKTSLEVTFKILKFSHEQMLSKKLFHRSGVESMGYP